MKLGHFKT